MPHPAPCHSYIERISLSVDDALGASEEAALAAHLARCPACRSLREDMAFLRTAMPEMAVPPPADLWPLVHARIARHSDFEAHLAYNAPRRPFLPASAARRALAPLSAAAVILFLAYQFLFISPMNAASPPPTAPRTPPMTIGAPESSMDAGVGYGAMAPSDAAPYPAFDAEAPESASSYLMDENDALSPENALDSQKKSAVSANETEEKSHPSAAATAATADSVFDARAESDASRLAEETTQAAAPAPAYRRVIRMAADETPAALAAYPQTRRGGVVEVIVPASEAERLWRQWLEEGLSVTEDTSHESAGAYGASDSLILIEPLSP